MPTRIAIALAVLVALAVGPLGLAPQSDAQDVKPLRVVSEQTVKGFAFPETVTYDPRCTSATTGRISSCGWSLQTSSR